MKEIWRWPNGDLVKFEELEKILKNNEAGVFVGSDSHMLGGQWIFATIIAVYQQGKGGRFIYVRNNAKKNDFMHLRQRLVEETLRSIEVATEIKEKFGREPEVHLDISTSLHKSSKYMKEIVAMVSAYGFKFQVKPNSWASSTLADRSAR